MAADTQNKLNSAAHLLAEIKDVLGRLEIAKIETYLDTLKVSADAADKLANNAIEQEKEASQA
ncbi:hypothetical protein CEW81_18345 [Kluyvera genomosp. 3]|uniref:Uncharacterized protein n=1 Tax=Kluyvera genomosp. 3 TaxID=2774055 RepID=A0A248KK82_9ENTR|nr:hypothetical protein CEW81_18345 [Kluyvera genomosp. 3]